MLSRVVRQSIKQCKSNMPRLQNMTMANNNIMKKMNFQIPMVASRSFSSDMDSENDDYFYEEEEKVVYPSSMAHIGQEAPTFSTKGVIDGEIVNVKLKDYRGKWVILIFYPKDFTFVCPTELIAFSERSEEFKALGAQLIACSTDTEESHLAWTRMPRKVGGLGKMDIPLIADVTKVISANYGVLNESVGIAFRGLFIINPQGDLEQSTVNNFPVGRSVDETLRLLQAFQFVAEHGEVCPANWTPGSATIVANPEDSQAYFATVEESEESSLSSLQVLKSAAQVKEVIALGKPVVLDFMAGWCGKCTQIEPFVQELSEQYDAITFVKVDTDSEGMEAVKEEHGVSALPTFKFFNNGNEVGTSISGYKKRLLKEQVAALNEA